ncbi:retinoblastoma-like protein 2 isoform X2 [Gouania willdenowi]|uniref:retinoblastoma-like protein 2 isoform X2 n=1 Tax=Gouania willdenowi TaxID=441366 RepID=UPI001054599C|nr:retinoblastoma-like protein 2 isoform X2 [Gouania willdenowi]
MTTALLENLGIQKFGPSNVLMAEFRSCSRDPSEAITKRLEQMQNIFLQHYKDVPTDTKAKAEQCSNKSQRWYYTILENIVRQEKRRLGIKDLSGLMEHDLFQRLLVACCLEITTVLNDLPCDFPLLLQIFKLVPYHFWRVIEPVLRSRVSFSRPVVRHFSQVEGKILEILVWTSDSPLWEEIRANGGGLPTCMEVMPAAKAEDPTQTDLQAAPNAPAAGSNICSLLSSGQQQKTKSLQLFSRKVYMLMDKRLRELSAALNIQDELQLKIWTCFEHSLVKCTFLMVDRHLDQLLLCAIYSMAKITGNEILFKRIMDRYKSLEHTSKTVLKNVLISDGAMGSFLGANDNEDLSPGLPTPNTPSAHYPQRSQEERGNLILFYNRVYATNMESYVVQFDPTSGGETPPLSVDPKVWRATRGQQRICNSSHRMALNMEDEEPQRDEGPSAKRSYRSVGGALERRLRSVVSDRANVRNQN